MLLPHAPPVGPGLNERPRSGRTNEILPLCVTQENGNPPAVPRGEEVPLSSSAVDRWKPVASEFCRAGRRETVVPGPGPNAWMQDLQNPPNSGPVPGGSDRRLYGEGQCRPRWYRVVVKRLVRRTDQSPQGDRLHPAKARVVPSGASTTWLQGATRTRGEQVVSEGPLLGTLNRPAMPPFCFTDEDLVGFLSEKKVAGRAEVLPLGEGRPAGYSDPLILVTNIMWPDSRKIIPTDHRGGSPRVVARTEQACTMYDGVYPGTQAPGPLRPKEVEEVQETPCRRETHHDPAGGEIVRSLPSGRDDQQWSSQVCEDLSPVTVERTSRALKDPSRARLNQIMRKTVRGGSQVSTQQDRVCYLCCLGLQEVEHCSLVLPLQYRRDPGIATEALEQPGAEEVAEVDQCPRALGHHPSLQPPLRDRQRLDSYRPAQAREGAHGNLPCLRLPASNVNVAIRHAGHLGSPDSELIPVGVYPISLVKESRHFHGLGGEATLGARTLEGGSLSHPRRRNLGRLQVAGGPSLGKGLHFRQEVRRRLVWSSDDLPEGFEVLGDHSGTTSGQSPPNKGELHCPLIAVNQRASNSSEPPGERATPESGGSLLHDPEPSLPGEALKVRENSLHSRVVARLHHPPCETTEPPKELPGRRILKANGQEPGGRNGRLDHPPGLREPRPFGALQAPSPGEQGCHALPVSPSVSHEPA
uniref:Uncharacterized protein n=1 Tax=Wenling narna-like virus 8 TaxID=1923508 RepID=A0A1L3KIS4_9VIRU|nr:hypothetical protein [Wenling narna-like virus 8]